VHVVVVEVEELLIAHGIGGLDEVVDHRLADHAWPQGKIHRVDPKFAS
jgi:hypothetical protein